MRPICQFVRGPSPTTNENPNLQHPGGLLRSLALMAPPRPPTGPILFLPLVFLFLFTTAVASAAAPEDEKFTEELLLRPLPDRKALAHFHFRSSAPPAASVGRHHHLFPKAISQLVRGSLCG